MKRFYYVLLCAGMCLSLFTQNSTAQDDLSIFGYFQSTFNHTDWKNDGETFSKSNSFAVQQLNVFLNKDLNEDFSALVNLELTNSFSSERNWGALNLEEAWVKYAHSDAFNIKAGLLIPKFNAMNEIKNKTPLLPYINRPLVYEASLAGSIDIEPFAPQRAFLQVYGNIPVGDAKFDYAVYAGNSDKLHINAGTGQRGVDTTTYKLIGGRVGFSISDLKVGVSGTYDREKLTTLGFGEVPRTRFGADLAYSIAGFTLEGELFVVNHTLTDAQQDTLKARAAGPFAFTKESTDKMFYFATLTYNISSDLYVYGRYDNYVDKLYGFTDGITSVNVGAGYRPIDQVVVKAQYSQIRFPDSPPFFVNSVMSQIAAGVSVFF